MSNVRNLVGIKIEKAFKYGAAIVLVTDKGVVQLSPEGDCCASCYITDVDCSEALLGIVNEVEDLVRPELSPEEYTDEASDVWGHRIHTDKGICTIGMRVDHNGYYSGSLQVYDNQNLDQFKDLQDLEDFTN